MNSYRKLSGSFCLVVVLMFAVLFVGTATAQDGELDHSFGLHGLVTTSFSTTSEGDSPKGVAVYPATSTYAGKFVVAGSSEDAGGDDILAVARYNSDGSLDTSFGTSGKQVIDGETVVNTNYDRGAGVAIQSDDKIVLVGNHGGEAFGDANYNKSLIVVRLNANGSIDTSFGTSGRVLMKVGSTYSSWSAIAVQKDGKILLGGRSGNYDCTIVRLNSNGSYDTQFVHSISSTSFEHIQAIQLGDEAAGSQTIYAVGYAHDGTNNTMMAMKLNSSGALQWSKLIYFNNKGGSANGVVLYDYNTDGTDEVIVGGNAYTADGSTRECAVAVLADNTTSAGYYSSFTGMATGRATQDINGYVQGTGVVVQSDGKIIGGSYASGQTGLCRFNTNGSLDTTFGSGDGIALETTGGWEYPYAFTLDNDGNILAVGATEVNVDRDFAIFRFLTSSKTMTYIRSDVTQETNDIFPDTTGGVIDVVVCVNGSTSPFDATSFSFNTSGTTSTADITSAKLYYTGNSANFIATGQFGGTVFNPSGAFSFTGTQTLVHGDNHFWLAYEIDPSATITNVVDATCTSLTVNSSARTPNPTAPSGSRPITAPYYVSFTSDNSFGDGITNVTFAGINNTTAVDATNGYADYTAQKANVDPGSSYTLSCTVAGDWPTYPTSIKVWFDWNRNYSFDDVGEGYDVATSITAAGPHSISVAVPAGAVAGDTRMRIASNGWTNGLTPDGTGGDGAGTYGEGEDYTVTVSSSNSAPEITQGAGPLSVTMSEDGSPTAWSAPTLGATDPDGDTLTWSVSSGASNGSATVSGTGGTPSTFNYSPNLNWSGSDSFTVRVSDNVLTDTIVVNVTVNAVNDPPSVDTNTGISVNEGQSVTIGSSELNEGDPDDSGTGLTYTITSGPGNGAIEVSGTPASNFTQDDIDNNRVTYVHNGSETTADSFNFSLADGGEDSAAAATSSVSISITPQNDPVVIDQSGPLSVTMDEDGSPTAWSTPTLSASDPDTGDTLTWSVSSGASNGTATVSGTGSSPGTFTYAPNADWNGSDSFQVQVSDGSVSDTITVNVTVNAQQDVPTINQSGPLSATMDEDGSPTAWSPPTLTASDPDAGATLTWSVSSAASNGTATVSGTGSAPSTFNYAPTANWNGSDSFEVQVSDGTDTDTITVNVTVDPQQDAVTIDQSGPLSVTMDEDDTPTAWSAPTLTASDLDASDTLTWSVSSAASNGTATVSGTGSAPTTFTYSPTADWNGSDSFEVQVSDGTDTDTITVNVTVNAQQDAPAIDQSGPLSVTMDEDGSPTAWSAPTLTASDPDAGATLTWSVSSAASNGTATVSGTGSAPTTFTYAPTADWNGTDSFEVQVSDGTDIDTITVDVTVNAVPDYDFGDAPDPTYPTLLANDGARHDTDAGLYLGTLLDYEADGQPTAIADGDDVAGDDDEDGIAFISTPILGRILSLEVTASAAGYLNAWIDLNADGDWADAGEQILTDEALVSGINSLSIPIPVSASIGTTYARFRFDSSGGLTVTGAAADGEVEDYLITIASPPEINVSGNAAPILDGDTTPNLSNDTDFGSVAVASGTIAKTYTIQNTGGAPLIISSVNITGTNAADFAVTTTPDASVAASASTSLTVTFDPSAIGVRSAIVTIVNDDDDETIFDFAIQGTGLNTAPVIDQSGPLAVTMSEDGVPTTWAAPTLSVTDPDGGDTLTWSVLTPATNGAATVSGTGTSPTTFSYAPNANYFGADSFEVQVSDGAESASITINVTIQPVNDPVVIDQSGPISVTMSEDGAPTVWSAPTLSATDIDAADTLTWSLLAQATNGTASVSGTGTAPGTLDYAPLADFNGADSFQVQVSDGNSTASITVNVTVEAVQDPVVIDQAGPLAVTMSEDGAPTAWVAPTISATDPDDADTLTWSLSGAATNGTATVSGTGSAPTTLDYTPTADFNGSDSFEVQVSDGTDSSVITVNVTVEAQNDAPVIAQSAPLEVTMSEDSVPTAWAAPALSATDVEAGTLTWSLVSAASFGVATVSGTGVSPTTFEYVSAENYFGTDSFTVSVSDGELTDSIVVDVTIESVNDAPVLTAIGPQEVDEGEALSITLQAIDVEDDQLTFNAGNLPSGATLNTDTNTIEWTPGFDTAGNYSGIIVTVTDDGTPPQADSEEFTITVGDVNRPPVLNAIGPQTVNENELLEFTLTGSDPDGDGILFAASNIPTGASFDPDTATFSWIPSFNDAGNYPDVLFSITDDGTPNESDSEAITITVGNVNRPPVLTAIGNQTVNEGATLSFVITATDPDGDTLTFSVVNLPEGASFEPSTQRFSWTPGFSDAGEFTNITFIVEDDGTPSSSDSESITITVNDVNRAPVLSAIGNQTVNEGETLSFTLDAIDPDDDALTFSASNLPAGANFNPATATFSWTPGFDASRAYSDIEFTVTDAHTLSDSEMILITVSDVNRAPVLSSVGNQTVSEGETLSFTLEANDADGDTLTFSASNLPSGASFDPTTATFSWTPGFSDAGDYNNVSFTVTDGNLDDDESITITVTNVNRSPVLNVVGNQSIAEGQTLSFSIGGSDPDGDALSFSASNLPAGASFNVATATFTWTPNFTDSGAYNGVTFIVTDDGIPALSVDETISITVTDVNRAPVLDAVGIQSIAEDQTLSFTLGATDPDGDVLTYSASNLPAGANFNAATATFTWTPSFSAAGEYTDIEFYVNDNGTPVLDDSETISITVTNVNRAPVLQPVGSKTVMEGETLSFTVAASDPDGDALVFSATNLPTGASFNPATATFTWTPGMDAAGTYTGIEITVTDSGVPAATDLEVIQVTVVDQNSEPLPLFITEGPTIDSITTESAIVIWRTDVLSDGLVEFGTTTAFGQEVEDTIVDTLHSVLLEGLSPGMRYYLRVHSVSEDGLRTGQSNIASFVTLPEADTEAPLILNVPKVREIATTSAVITWSTNEPATTDVLLYEGDLEIPLSLEGLDVDHVMPVIGLTPGTTYTFVVQSTDRFGNGPAESGVGTFTTRQIADNTAPRIIEGPTVEKVSSDVIVVRWRTDELSDSSVEFGVTEGLGQVTYDGTLRTDHRVSVVGLNSDTAYYLQVNSTDLEGNGPTTSSVVSASTLPVPDTTAPLFIFGPEVVGRTDRTATIYWETDEPSDSVIEYGTSEPLTQRRSDPSKTLRHQITLVSLRPGQVYQYICYSTDTATPGNTASSTELGTIKQDEVLTFTTDVNPDVTSPTITDGLYLSGVTDTTATLEWTTDEIADTVVTYHVMGETEVKTVGDDLPVKNHLITLTKLLPATTYIVTVSSTDVAGNPPVVSEEYQLTTEGDPDTEAPAFAYGPNEENITETSATLVWETNELTSGEIVWGLSADALTEVRATIDLGASQSIVMTRLAPGTTYYYRVRSVDQMGNVQLSEIESFTTAGQAATTVTIQPDAETLEINGTVQLTATSTDVADTEAGFSWVSSDPLVASVNENGFVTALSAGQTTITATGNSSTASGTATITVNAAPDDGGSTLGFFGLLVALVALFTGGDSGSSGSGGPCFIATAAYGTPLAAEIETLRTFRDSWLLDNALGSAFVDTYYRVSPPVADLVAQSPALRLAVRVLLIPVLIFAKLLLIAPKTLLIAVMLGLAGITIRCKASKLNAQNESETI